jgi:hypothetical protein
MADDRKEPARAETTLEKTARLKAARLEAGQQKDQRIERATRKAAARRKVLGAKP